MSNRWARAALLALSCSFVVVAGVSSSSAMAAPLKPLKVELNGPYPPFQFQKAGKWVGPDIDLFNAAAKYAGYAPTYGNQKVTAQVIPSLLSGRFDASDADSGDIAARHQAFYIVDVYDTYADVITSTAVPSKAALCGKRLGIYSGSPVEQGWADYFNSTVCPSNHAQIIEASTGSPTDFVVALAAGRIDGFLIDPISAQGLLKAKKNLHVAGSFKQPGTGLSGWIVLHKNKQLALQLQAGLKHVVTTGQYTRILAKWGISSIAYKGATINAAGK